MTQHIFVYLPHSKIVSNRKYLCKCEECVNVNFSSCLEQSKGDKEVAIIVNALAKVQNDCELDNNDNDATRKSESTDVPSDVSAITLSLSQLVYIIKILEKDAASEVMYDRNGHKILAGKFHFHGNYLKLVRQRNIQLKQFELISFDALISPEEVFESFIEVNSDLTINLRLYLALCE